MALRSILTSDRPVLRQHARAVHRVDATVRTLLADMVDTMREAPGVGLAAPQVGVSLRVIVVEYEDHLYRLINPELTWVSDELLVADEGCLSIPGYVGSVERHGRARVRARDSKGKPTTINADGWLARIFQHEIDHLDGILFTERMAPGERLRPIPEDEAEDASTLLAGAASE